MENVALERAKREYSQTESRYVEELKRKGLIFAKRGSDEEACEELRAKLEELGVMVRNAGSSLSVGHLSPACVDCTGDAGSETFSTTFKCHRDCYFCFNRNQPDYQRFFDCGCPWEEGLQRSYEENGELGSVGLTGGEPLLDLDASIEFLRRASELFPKAHKRLYTSGDLLDEDAARRLAEAGLDEIRFSVKDDDPERVQSKVLHNMEIAKRHIDSVMVEMPVIPGTKERMQDLLREFDRIGIDGINMLEFCFPFARWEEFEKRGFKLKNPPFEIMYDYGYSGGLAVSGSEQLILELMIWCVEERMGIGLHYCSLENKHRSEIRIKNTRIAGQIPYFEFDEGDFFLKAGKAFGPDVPLVRRALQEAGCDDVREDEQEESLVFPLGYMDRLEDVEHSDGSKIQPQICYYVYECDDDGSYLVDIALEDAF